jgi:hypothetical protein
LGEVDFGLLFAFDFDDHVRVWRFDPYPADHEAFVFDDSVFEEQGYFFSRIA